MGYKDGKLVCNSCQTVVTEVTVPPSDGWPNLNVLCSACFAKLSASKGA